MGHVRNLSIISAEENDEMSTCLRLSSVCLWKNTSTTTTPAGNLFLLLRAFVS